MWMRDFKIRLDACGNISVESDPYPARCGRDHRFPSIPFLPPRPSWLRTWFSEGMFGAAGRLPIEPISSSFPWPVLQVNGILNLVGVF